MRWTGRALRVAAHLDDPDLHAFCLRTHGNELRRAGRTAAATVRIVQAVALDAPQQRSPALLQLARVATDPATFDSTFGQLQRSRDTGPADDPVVTETAMLEVRLRRLTSLVALQHAAGPHTETVNAVSGIAFQIGVVTGSALGSLAVAAGHLNSLPLAAATGGVLMSAASVRKPEPS